MFKVGDRVLRKKEHQTDSYWIDNKWRIELDLCDSAQVVGLKDELIMLKPALGCFERGFSGEKFELFYHKSVTSLEEYL